MTEEQTNQKMVMMEQLAGDVRELTYAIRTMAEVMERREIRIAPTQREIQSKLRNNVKGGIG